METVVNWLAETPGSIALHESLYMYAYVETAHVMGIMLFVGTIAMVDLRLIGVSFRQTPISEMLHRVLPWTVAGFIVMVITGVLLFYAIPVRTYHSVWFRLKLILLLAGAINIFMFHRRVEREKGQWDLGPVPHGAKVAAVVSLSVWGSIIVFGRFIAYNWFDCDHGDNALAHAFAGCPVVEY